MDVIRAEMSSVMIIPFLIFAKQGLIFHVIKIAHVIKLLSSGVLKPRFPYFLLRVGTVSLRLCKAQAEGRKRGVKKE